MKTKPSKILDQLYTTGKKPIDAEPNHTSGEREMMVLHQSSGARIAKSLEIPELDIELDRAVWQVEKALREEAELREEKRDLDKANAAPKKKD